jgi:hypothetical protein
VVLGVVDLVQSFHAPLSVYYVTLLGWIAFQFRVWTLCLVLEEAFG